MPITRLPCFAYTNSDPIYPGYVNIQHMEDGGLTVTFRPKNSNGQGCPETFQLIVPAKSARDFDEFAFERNALLTASPI